MCVSRSFPDGRMRLLIVMQSRDVLSEAQLSTHEAPFLYVWVDETRLLLLRIEIQRRRRATGLALPPRHFYYARAERSAEKNAKDFFIRSLAAGVLKME